MSVTGTTLHRRISSPVYGHLVSLSDDIGDPAPLGRVRLAFTSEPL